MRPRGPGALGAKKVRFGADRIFCNKSWSVETYSTAVKKVCGYYGIRRWMSIAKGRNRYRALIEKAVAAAVARKAA